MPRPSFPRSLVEFQARFHDEASCRRYLAESRWPNGFRCPACGQGDALGLPTRLLWRCRACGRDTSATAGTVLHRTRTPLTHWFWAAYLVTTHTPGLSALQLQRQLGIRRYETAWTILHKLRRAMVRPDRDLLRGKVESTRPTSAALSQAFAAGGRSSRRLSWLRRSRSEARAPAECGSGSSETPRRRRCPGS